MLKVLVAVDGSPSSDHAVEFLVRLAKERGTMEVHLLNVQESIEAWEVRRFLRDEEIEAMQTTRGDDALRAARTLLDRAGIRYTPHKLVGPVAETISRFAEERHCDEIVIGTRGLGAIEGLFLGSVTTKVIHLSHLPVTLVK